MQDTIFAQILNGTIPCHKVYEDEHSLAFLDIRPVQPGHTLVIPKQPATYVWDLSSDEYANLMATAHKVAARLKAVFPDHFVAMHIEGLEVAYAHLKLFPFLTDAEFRRKPDADEEPDHAALAQMAEKLAF